MAADTERENNDTTSVSKKAYLIWNSLFVAGLGFGGLIIFNLALDNARIVQQLTYLQRFADDGPRWTKTDDQEQTAIILRHIEARVKPFDEHLIESREGYKRIRELERRLDRISVKNGFENGK